MALGLNKVMLLGNLGKDPDIQIFEGGVKKASFTMATSEAYRDKEGNRIDKVEWHNVVAWRNLAETMERFLRKGSKVYIEGKIRTRNYQDQSGSTRYITEIVAENLILLDRRETGEGATNYANSPITKPQQPISPNDPVFPEATFDTPLPMSDEDNDLPF